MRNQYKKRIHHKMEAKKSIIPKEFSKTRRQKSKRQRKK
jgi:hypothetical protein